MVDQGLVNVPTIGDLYILYGFIAHHLPISVGDEISPFQLGDVKHWDIYQPLQNRCVFVGYWLFPEMVVPPKIPKSSILDGDFPL